MTIVLTADRGANVPPSMLRNRLREAREWKGLNQADIAADLGVARTTVSNYEKGVTVPGKLAINAWAVICDVDVDWLKSGRTNDEGPASEETGPVVHPPGLEPGTHWFPHNVTVGFFGEDGQRKHEGGDSATASAYWQENPMGARRQVRPIVKLVRLGRFVRDGQVA